MLHDFALYKYTIHIVINITEHIGPDGSYLPTTSWPY